MNLNPQKTVPLMALGIYFYSGSIYYTSSLDLFRQTCLRLRFQGQRAFTAHEIPNPVGPTSGSRVSLPSEPTMLSNECRRKSNVALKHSTNTEDHIAMGTSGISQISVRNLICLEVKRSLQGSLGLLLAEHKPDIVIDFSLYGTFYLEDHWT